MPRFRRCLPIIALALATVLGGCVVYPAGGYREDGYGYGHHHRHYDRW